MNPTYAETTIAADLVAARWHIVSATARLLLERNELGPDGISVAMQAAMAQRQPF